MIYDGECSTGTILLAVGILWAAGAAWQFCRFVAFGDAGGALDVPGGGGPHLWTAVGAAVLTRACVRLGIFRRINHTGRSHVTS